MSLPRVDNRQPEMGYIQPADVIADVPAFFSWLVARGVIEEGEPLVGLSPAEFDKLRFAYEEHVRDLRGDSRAASAGKFTTSTSITELPPPSCASCGRTGVVLTVMNGHNVCEAGCGVATKYESQACPECYGTGQIAVAIIEAEVVVDDEPES